MYVEISENLLKKKRGSRRTWATVERVTSGALSSACAGNAWSELVTLNETESYLLNNLLDGQLGEVCEPGGLDNGCNKICKGCC